MTLFATKAVDVDPKALQGLTPGPAGTAVNNIVVQDGCAIDRTAHRGLAATRRVAAFVLNALDDASHRPAPGAVVEPNSGVG
ncbi:MULTISPECIES: hypothetical protein [Actinomycetes]|uniref:hypothetical protein n=1 Tax=Actinomycetes TaxID=1760 RepID=UPI0004C2460E|nr:MULTISPECIES: hypothetical protein [Actinomycetes]